jgi:hypothetical protein
VKISMYFKNNTDRGHMGAPVYNPKYTGDRDLEDRSLRPAWTKY